MSLPSGAMYLLRHVLSLGLFISLAAPQSQYPFNAITLPELLNADLADLRTGLEQRSFTSEQLAQTYIDRINEVNDRLHAVNELNPDALKIARESDARRATHSLLGPLDGIPVLIKDNIATSDSMNNTAGSWALVGAKVSQDSTVVKKLRKAGAVILGKATLSEWAFWRSDNSTSGWSPLGGQCYGAYYPNQNPSGSSSGSAVAASVGLAFATLGTETSGSIIMPASMNNLVGIKPSVGLTSRFLVVPISEHQDTIGPLARTVSDAAHMLQVIAGPDPNDNYTSATPIGAAPDYVAALNMNALAGARLGIARNVIDLSVTFSSGPVLEAFDAAVSVLEAAGATIIENTNFTEYEQFLDDSNWFDTVNADFLSALPKYLAELTVNPHELHNVRDLQNFTHAHPLEEYPDRNTARWDGALEQGFNNSDPHFWYLYQKNLQYGGEGGILGALARDNLDAVLLPSHFSTAIPALVGAPIISVPMGFYPANISVEFTPRGDTVQVGPGIPFGLSFLGARFSEEKLLGFAYAYEQRTHVRKRQQPYILPSTDLGDIVGKSTEAV